MLQSFNRKPFSAKHLTKRLIAAVTLFVATLMLSSCVALVRPNFETQTVKLREGQYTLDQRHSFVHFKVSHLGLSTYVGRFNTFDASMDFDPDNLVATRLEGSVELDSIDTGDPEVDELLIDPGWFNIAQHPQAVFKTTAVSANENDALLITGDLSLRGITRLIELEGVFNGGADNLLTGKYTIGFTAKGSFSRSAFEMTKFAGLVGDEVRIEIYAEFLKN